MNANSRLFFSKTCLPKELNYSKADRQEIGNQAVWSLSSAKQGFGVEQLRDNNIETYWQSDGSQPHLVNIQFHKRSAILEVDLYVDYKLDESYTPSKISVRSGTTFHDLKEIKLIELEEPSGWVSIPLPHPSKPDGVLRTNFIQIAVLSNHQNGRDTHVRQIRVYGPSRYSHLATHLTHRTHSPSDDILGQFHSEEFLLYDILK